LGFSHRRDSTVVTQGGFERAAATLAGETTVRGLLNATCRELVGLLGGSACAVSRVVGDLLVGLAEYTSSDRRPLELGHEYLISDYPLTQEVVEGGEPRRVSVLDDDPEPHEAALLERLGFDSLLMVPLPSSGHCWGLVEVYADGRRFDEASGSLAERVAAYAGTLLEPLERARET
jgi:GAF domain-containing protein